MTITELWDTIEAEEWDDLLDALGLEDSGEEDYETEILEAENDLLRV